MNNKNYYEILGLSKTASTKEIRVAYHERVNRYAMQMNASSRDFDYHRQLVTKAYETLADKKLRAGYDRSISDISNPNPNS